MIKERGMNLYLAYWHICTHTCFSNEPVISCSYYICMCVHVGTCIYTLSFILPYSNESLIQLYRLADKQKSKIILVCFLPLLFPGNCMTKNFYTFEKFLELGSFCHWGTTHNSIFSAKWKHRSQVKWIRQKQLLCVSRTGNIICRAQCKWKHGAHCLKMIKKLEMATAAH